MNISTLKIYLFQVLTIFSKLVLILFIAVITVLMINSCVDDDTGAPKDKNDDNKNNDTNLVTYENGIFILNEGNFDWGHGSIYFYDFNTNKITENIFKKANNRIIGNVLQSMTVYNEKAYMLLTNSGKIEVTYYKTMKSITVIEQINSPRFLQIYNNEKAFVSSMFGNGIYVIDIVNNNIIKKINAEGWNENMVLLENKLFVANAGKNRLLIINPDTDQILNIIDLKAEPKSIVVDIDNYLWILCTGGFSETYPALYKIDPVEENIVKELIFSVKQDYPDKLAISPNGQTIYFINQNIYRFDIIGTNLPESPFIESNGRVFNSIGIDPVNGYIFVSDAKDYISNGKIYHYDQQGIMINSFDAGIIPGFFHFN